MGMAVHSHRSNAVGNIVDALHDSDEDESERATVCRPINSFLFVS